MTAMGSEISYDPYDFEIDSDPYPVWKRLRDDRPLYYNERYDFYALSRFDDVEQCSADWKTYISGKGTVLEVIKNGMEFPPGSIIFEDPPAHDVHRGLLSRLFTPRQVLADHPDQRRELVDDPSLIPNAIEELLRFESPSPVQARTSTVRGWERLPVRVP